MSKQRTTSGAAPGAAAAATAAAKATTTKATKVFDETDGIHLQKVGEDHCLVDFEGARIVLSYDATCDLATRLAYFLCQIEEENAEALTPPTLLN